VNIVKIEDLTVAVLKTFSWLIRHRNEDESAPFIVNYWRVVAVPLTWWRHVKIFFQRGDGPARYPRTLECFGESHFNERPQFVFVLSTLNVDQSIRRNKL